MKKSPFGFKRAKDSPGFLLWKMTMTWQRLVKKTLDEFDITHPQFVILAVTAWHSLQGCIVTQRLLIAESKLDKMTISISVKKLVLEGFLRQFDHLEDARAKQIELTPRGEKMANKVFATKFGPNIVLTKPKQYGSPKNYFQFFII